MILLYRLDQDPLLPAIQMLAAMREQEIRLIQPAEAFRPVREVLEGEGFDSPMGTAAAMGPAVSAPVAAAAGPVIGTPPEDPLILFAGMDQEEVSRWVDQLKALSGGASSKILKAMVTPTNIQWSISYLLEHLKEERAYFQKRRS